MLSRRGFLSTLALLSGGVLGSDRTIAAPVRSPSVQHFRIGDLELAYPAWLKRSVERDSAYDTYAFSSEVVSFEILVTPREMDAESYVYQLIEAFRDLPVAELSSGLAHEGVRLCGRTVNANVLRVRADDQTKIVHEVFDLPLSPQQESRVLVLQRIELEGLPSGALFREMWETLQTSLACGNR